MSEHFKYLESILQRDKNIDQEVRDSQNTIKVAEMERTFIVILCDRSVPLRLIFFCRTTMRPTLLYGLQERPQQEDGNSKDVHVEIDVQEHIKRIEYGTRIFERALELQTLRIIQKRTNYGGLVMRTSSRECKWTRGKLGYQRFQRKSGEAEDALYGSHQNLEVI